MSATVYNPPEGITAPDFADMFTDGRYDRTKDAALEATYLGELREWLKSHGYTGQLAGEEVHWPRADGYARYLVCSLRPLRLMHLPLGDAWSVDAIFQRGLTAADVRGQVESQHRMAALFKSKA